VSASISASAEKMPEIRLRRETGHWDTIRPQTEAAIAEEVVDAGSNRRNQARRNG